MVAFEVRPARPDDACSTFPDLLADRWRPGDNRRSFVAVDQVGNVLGHARGIDNRAHPDSRVMVLEVRPDQRGTVVEDALVDAVVSTSTRLVSMKIAAHQTQDLALAKRHGAVLAQLCPPWRRVVDAALLAWASTHRGPTEPIAEADRAELRELEVDHYMAQHASWSPAAPREVMLDYFAGDHDPTSPTAWDATRSVAVKRDGCLVAAGLLWPPDADTPQAGREVTLLARPYEGPETRRDKEACLAAIIASGHEGDVLCVDAHVTEQLEMAMMAEVPAAPVDASNDWLAIVHLPVPGVTAPPSLPIELVPDEASWARSLCRREPAP